MTRAALRKLQSLRSAGFGECYVIPVFSAHDVLMFPVLVSPVILHRHTPPRWRTYSFQSCWSVFDICVDIFRGVLRPLPSVGDFLCCIFGATLVCILKVGGDYTFCSRAANDGRSRDKRVWQNGLSRVVVLNVALLGCFALYSFCLIRLVSIGEILLTLKGGGVLETKGTVRKRKISVCTYVSP